MMNLLLVGLLVAPVSAAVNFDSPSKDNAPFLTEFRAQPQVIGRAKLQDLSEWRDEAAVVVRAGGREFLFTPAFDAAWNVYLSVKPRAAAVSPGIWKEDELPAGVRYSYGGVVLSIKDVGGKLKVSWEGGSAETDMGKLFDGLYEKSAKVNFGEIVSYALIRNVEPGSGKEGTVTMRLGSDGLYYYSLTQDAEILAAPRWLLAINGVLYGLKVDGADLAFMSKKIENMPKFLSVERVRRR